MFELLWTDHADLVSTYDSRAEAEAALLSYATEHPELADEIAVIEIDDQGERVSDFLSGGELLARRGAAA